MKPFIQIIALILFPAVAGNGMAQETVSAAGNYSVNDLYQLSWTLGETAIETLGTKDLLLTQGLHQQNMCIASIGELHDTDYEISAFPNPVSESITVKITNLSAYENLKKGEKPVIRLYDIKGILLYEKYIISNETSVSMTSFPPSVYILKIRHGNTELKSLHIIKN